MSTEKARENRLRRAAARQGFGIVKSRRRDSRATDFGGYMLVNVATNYIEFGGSPNAFSCSLDEIEKYLRSPKKPRSRGPSRKDGAR